MTYSVYQHWDTLKVCVVGRSYPPEFYNWIKVPHVRSLFEKIAIETEEDYQAIIKKLQEFGVEVLRPNLPKDKFLNFKFLPPPMTPRDYTIMVGNTFYENCNMVHGDFVKSYNDVKDPSWPVVNNIEDFRELPESVKQECSEIHKIAVEYTFRDCYSDIFDKIKSQGNRITSSCNNTFNGAMVSRIGKDLYFGTDSFIQDTAELRSLIDTEFKSTRNHVINTGGHADCTYCPVAPGLIISLHDVPTYAETYPGWEVVYLPGQSWGMVKDFLSLKEKNKGKWWIPGFEQDQAVVDVVEEWLGHWTGYVEETVFDVNMLIIDPKNVIVFSYNKQVFDALARYGITPHIVPFRHRWFWDGGIHCITSDIHREGTRQDYFPERTS